MPEDIDWQQQHPSGSKRATDKEKLLLQIRATIEFQFGTMCDRLHDALKAQVVSLVIESLQRDMRTAGNTAIRHIENHAQNYNISRKHEKDKINLARVQKKFENERGESHDSED